MRLEKSSSDLTSTLRDHKEQCTKAVAETAKLTASAEVLGKNLASAVCDLKTTKTLTAEKMIKLEESIALRLTQVEEKLQSECSSLRGRHGDLKVQYSHLKSQVEDVSVHLGEGLQRKLDELDMKAIVAVDSLEKRCLGSDERQNEKMKVLEAKLVGVMNSSDLGTVAERLRGVMLRVEQAERIASESQKQVDDVRLRVDRLRRGLPLDAGTSTSSSNATPVSSSTSGAVERCEHLEKEIESIWRRLSRVEGKGIDGQVSSGASRDCNAAVEAMRSEIGGQVKQITRKCASFDKALDELRRQVQLQSKDVSAAELRELREQLKRHGGSLQRLDEAVQHTRSWERSNEERRVETKVALEKLQHRFENYETNCSKLESRVSSAAGMSQPQELQIVSLVEQAFGSSLRNSVDYAVRRTESLGDRIRALEDTMNDFGDNARATSTRNSQGHWSDARWASDSNTIEAPRRAQAERGAPGNSARTPSNPPNIGPPSTPRDRPLSAGAHRRLRSASPANSDGADRRPEVGEAWGVDPPRIPRRVTPPPT